MRRLMLLIVLAVLVSTGGAKADPQPVVCGGVQTAVGVMTCQVDATTANGQLSSEYGFFAYSGPGTTTTNRVDLIDSRGRVVASTGNETSEGTLFAGGIGEVFAPGIYTCKLTSTGAPTVVGFSCAVT